MSLKIKFKRNWREGVKNHFLNKNKEESTINQWDLDFTNGINAVAHLKFTILT